MNIKKTILLFFCSILFIFSAAGQVTADPATGQMDIVSLAGVPENANMLAPNKVVSLKVPVYNFSQVTTIPPNYFQFKIALGALLTLDPAYNLNTAPLSNYFTWTVALVNGEQIITGTLTNALPEDFADIASFNVKGTVTGTSQINTTVVITGPLTDEDADNNLSILQYTITNQVLPVTFTTLNLTKNNCTITAAFTVEGEVNVNQYEIEAGTDGINYKKVAELKAANRKRYSASHTFQTGSKTLQFVRIKSIDNDGKVKYSETKTIKGVCEAVDNFRLNTAPNPLTNQVSIAISSGDVLLKGQYHCLIADFTGRIVQQQNIRLFNTAQFNLSVAGLPSGSYFIKLVLQDGSSAGTAKIVKL